MPVARSQRQRQMFNELRGARVARGLSRQQLADLVEVNVQTIGALERGHYSPSLYLALLIADALDVDLHDIFWLDGGSARADAGTGATAMPVKK